MRQARNGAAAFTAAIALWIGGCEPAGEGRERRGSATGRAIVNSVADGDTINVRIDGQAEAVRLIGVDTPEVHGERECGGAAASAAMRRRAPVGVPVRLVADRSQDGRDHYGRLLRYAEARGVDLGLAQIRSGHAASFVYDPVRPPERAALYARAYARAAGRGARGACGDRWGGGLG